MGKRKNTSENIPHTTTGATRATGSPARATGRAKRAKNTMVSKSNSDAGLSTEQMSDLIKTITEAVTQNVITSLQGTVARDTTHTPTQPDINAHPTGSIDGTATRLDDGEAGRPGPSGTCNADIALGMPPVTTNVGMPTLVTSSLPLGYNVSDKLRRQILENDYVDFSCLVFPSDDNDPSVKLTVNGTGVGFSQAKGKQLRAMFQWNQAFDIYVAIYCTKYSELIAGLIKYGHTVRQINQFFGFNAAKYYDQNFRQLRKLEPLDWSKIHDELWRLAALQTRTNTGPPPTSGSQFFRPSASDMRKLPNGFCFAYGRFGKCSKTNCTYKHVCATCNGKHPTRDCNSQPPTSAAIGITDSRIRKGTE
ncbi:MAG: hypothetical protein ABW185_10490 [Sedimenticola sp.]